MKCSALTLGLFVVVLSGCSSTESPLDVSDSWITFTAGKALSFLAPPDLVAKPVQNEDSFGGKYDSPALELTFDYGKFSDPLELEGYRDWKFRTTTIDGKRAKIGWSDDRMAVHFPKVEGKNKLSMFANLKQPQAKEIAEIIFRSIDFP